MYPYLVYQADHSVWVVVAYHSMIVGVSSNGAVREETRHCLQACVGGPEVLNFMRDESYMGFGTEISWLPILVSNSSSSHFVGPRSARIWNRGRFPWLWLGGQSFLLLRWSSSSTKTALVIPSSFLPPLFLLQDLSEFVVSVPCLKDLVKVACWGTSSNLTRDWQSHESVMTSLHTIFLQKQSM